VIHAGRALATIRDRILTADPGFVRLDTAARTTAAVAATTGIMLIAQRFLSIPQVIVLLGAIASWISAITVNDQKLEDRRVTTASIPLPAIAGMALGTAVAGNPARVDLVFLVVVFFAAYVRRFGQRYVSLGVVGFLAYFFSLFVDATIAELPVACCAIVVGVGSTYVMRFVVVPKHRQGSLWSVMQSILAQLRIATERARNVPASRVDRLEVLVRAIARVNETMLAIEEQGIIAAPFEDIAFSCELAAENLLVATFGGTDATCDAASRELADAMERARHAAASPAPEPTASSAQREAILEESRRPAIIQYGLRLTTRQAMQITTAAAAAIVVGNRISPQRWYWAVLIAFIVFTGTTSSGETLTRAWASILGTMIGVLAGVVVGTLVHGHIAFETGLFFLSMLGAAYFLRSTAYGVASFFIVTMLALLYSLLGRFTEQILLVRFLETVTGATFGVLAATVFLRTSTRLVFRADVRAVLETLRDALAVLADAHATDAVPASRRCDAAVRRLRVRIDPLRSGPTFAGSSGFARSWLWALELCAYHLRNAAGIHRRDAGEDGEMPAAALRETRARAEELIAMIDADEVWPYRSSGPLDLEPPYLPEPRTEHFITHIYGILVHLK
jgi:hypothetical protein